MRLPFGGLLFYHPYKYILWQECISRLQTFHIYKSLTLHTGSGNLKLIRKLGINSEFSYGYKQFEGPKDETEVICITICSNTTYCISGLFWGKDSSKQAGTSKSGTPKDGGALTIGVSDNPDTMNPLYANDRVSLTVQQALYAPLYHMEDGKKSLFLLRALRLQKIN